VATSTTIGLAAAAGVSLAAERDVVEKDVEVRTADGTCDAAFLHPATGTHPGVLIWTDIFGLRPTFRAMGRRLAAQGYAVLVPNPFYRTARAPVVVDASSFNFDDPANRAQAGQWTASLKVPGAIERDAEAHTAFLDAQLQVDRTRKLGVHGYCMGGPLVFRTAAQAAGRIGAAATFHGGGLVTDKPDSPHLLVPRIEARMYLAVAASDDAKQPDAKDKLREAFAAARLPAEVEVYPGTIHGWCVPDMPRHDGKPIYNKPDAERAWAKLLELYHTVLA
ncbi:MAG: dienelactone hydrolase family protein, partial [Steroidobacteraceae bacterium]